MEQNPSYTPYKSGYLPVSDGHELYYECCGNPNGTPVLFLHGGPGGGFDDSDKRYFNLKHWNVILFDQRGSGRSKPFASLNENTTQKLVADITALLDTLGLSKVVLFGGSWGSTLALIYAVEHPEKVLAMILRGIFLGTKDEIAYWTQGGVAEFFPDVWERFSGMVPTQHQHEIMKYYDEQMKSPDEKTREKFVYEWARYEMSLMHIQATEESIEADLKKFSFASLSPIEIHYMLNNCFIPENYILDNVHKLSDKPVSIVQGRYDIVCPPISAYQLKKALPQAKLSFVISGHSSSEPETGKALTQEMTEFEKKF